MKEACCPECKSSKLKILNGELCCTSCGYIIAERLWQTGLEPKYESEQIVETDQQQLATWIDE